MGDQGRIPEAHGGGSRAAHVPALVRGEAPRLVRNPQPHNPQHMLACDMSAMPAHCMPITQAITGASPPQLPAAALQDNDITVKPLRLGHISAYIAKDQHSSSEDVSQRVHLMLLTFRIYLR